MAIESLQQQIPFAEGVAPVVPVDGLMNSMRELPLDQKVRGSLKLMGAEFWDSELGYVRDNAVSLCTLGGVPIARHGESQERTQERLAGMIEGGRETMALSAAMSYLNSGNLAPDDLYQKVTGLGHFSIAHTVTAGVLVAGLTTAVECELDTQRDLVHLSRITVARTAIQTRPPLVAPNKQSYELTRRIAESTEAFISEARGNKPTRDEHEVLNRLYPASKATAVLVHGTLRNFSKLTSQRDDTGKELEYRQILTKMHGMFNTLWPELFEQ